MLVLNVNSRWLLAVIFVVYSSDPGEGDDLCNH